MGVAERTAFLLNSSSDVAELETVEIFHSEFSQTFFFVRNKTDGLVANNENDDTLTFLYLPMTIEESKVNDSLDYSLVFELGDVGELLPSEFDRISVQGFSESPSLTYRTFRSDDLSLLQGPIPLKIKSFVFNATGCTFEASADRANLSRTGEFYTVSRFPMMRGLQ